MLFALCLLHRQFLAAGIIIVACPRTIDRATHCIIDRTIKMYKIYLYEHDVAHDELALPRAKSYIIEEQHAREKRLIRKVDLRLLPILGALYAISLVDRVNVR
jgi:hypothetical protein